MAKLGWYHAGTKLWADGRRIECMVSDRDTMKFVWYDCNNIKYLTSTGRCQGDWNVIGFHIALDNEGGVCGVDDKYFP